MRDIILNILQDSLETKEQSIKNNIDLIQRAADLLAESITSGHKILLFGNGGSAADAQHIAAEFVNRFQVERQPLAALSLTTDTSIITSIGNDYDFNEIFSKQIIALGKQGDIAVGLSTSGNSKNVIQAVEAAKRLGIFTIGLTGRGGLLADCADLVFKIESDTTARVQETHITLAHMLCDLVERILFPEKFSSHLS